MSFTLKCRTRIVASMPTSRVTTRFRVRIPREVREGEVKPGEVVSVEALSGDEILVKRYPHTSTPLETLIGTKPASRRVPVEELEERMESRPWRHAEPI
jgi:bifunctional DNA-binding transcriptional regulator/antitoxin component of YhaV-PrlF toxin-antitoxin module